jgi:hypothetical protein
MNRVLCRQCAALVPVPAMSAMSQPADIRFRRGSITRLPTAAGDVASGRNAAPPGLEESNEAAPGQTGEWQGEKSGPEWEIRPPRCKIKDSCSAMGADMGSCARGGGHGSIAAEVWMFKSARGYSCGRRLVDHAAAGFTSHPHQICTRIRHHGRRDLAI